MQKILRVIAKCSDCCTTQLLLDDVVIADTRGYVPENLGIGGGDYMAFELDLETGTIIGWKPISQDNLDNLISQDTAF